MDQRTMRIFQREVGPQCRLALLTQADLEGALTAADATARRRR